VTTGYNELTTGSNGLTSGSSTGFSELTTGISEVTTGNDISFIKRLNINLGTDVDLISEAVTVHALSLLSFALTICILHI
jgi:hypothetical protein